MARRRGPTYQVHHIRYGDEVVPEWTISLRMWMHRAVTLLQQMKPTHDNYAEAINFQHAVTSIINDMRMNLDREEQDA